MPIYVDKLPQQEVPIRVLTMKELVDVMPENLHYKENVWIGDRLARYGKTTENLIFYIEADAPIPSPEVRSYFNSLVESLGFQATASCDWRANNREYMVRLYNEGRLIIDKKTMKYKEVPTEVKSLNFTITADELIVKLPKEIEWNNTIYLTGGLAKNGFSNNDVDFIIFDALGQTTLNAIRKKFADVLSCKVHTGNSVMAEREPVYLYKIYENGKICQ